jgi:beta-lactam-binding protein with PASTA domain
VDPAEAVAQFMEEEASPDSPRAFRYFHVPPSGAGGEGGEAEAGGAGRTPTRTTTTGASGTGSTGAGGSQDAGQAKSAALTQPTANAYDRPITPPGQNQPPPDAESPRQIFDRFMNDVVEAGARAGQHGSQGQNVINDPNGTWGDDLIRATVALLDANGDKSPKAIKQLIRSGTVSEEHAALMWTARNLIVNRAMERVVTELKQRYPGFKFEITILDSGSYGSIGSDIDKTLHVTAWDVDGNEVKALGPGGQILGGNIDEFLRIVVDEFNAEGTKFGARNPIAPSTDTEFFTSDTLPERFPGKLARGATHSTSESPISRVSAALRQNFAGLQRNPGPAYQFVATVVSQIVGRTVEQDVLLSQRIEELRQSRQDLETLDTNQRRGLFLNEMLTTIHSPAVVVAEDAGRTVIRPIDVVDFLERNNLAIAYPADMAAANAVGNHEKLTHKSHHIIDDQGRFHADQYDVYRNDIAKYGMRSKHDTAMTLFADDDPGKPAKFGGFNRRFGAADYEARFGQPPPPNLREYTFDVHRAILEPALQRLHASGGMTPEAQQRIETDLALYWASNQISETLTEIKYHPSFGDDFPPETLFGPLISYIEENEPGRFGDLSGLSPEEQQQRRIQAAQQLHVEAEERATILITAGNMELALDTWLRSPEGEITRMVNSERGKLVALRSERDELIRRFVPPGTPESDAKAKQLTTLNTKITEGEDLVRWLQSSPEEARAYVQANGHEFARRMFALYVLQSDDSPEGARQRANFARMVELAGPEYRRDLEIMWRVWRVQAAEPETKAYAQGIGVDLARIGRWTSDVAGRLSYGYANSFGVDMDAYFRARAGVPVNPNINSAGQVLGRFVRNNYLHVGLAASPLNLIRTMQLSRGLPYEQRMAMMADAVGTEMITPIPAIGPVYLTWKGYQAGDPKAIAGGVINGVQELASQWIGVAAQSLDDAMIQAGQGARAAALGRVAMVGGLLPLVLNLARTSVEIVGTEMFDPLQDLYYQLAYKGYVDVGEPGIFTGLRDFAVSIGQARIDVTPIIEPDGPGAFEFIYLKPEVAQGYLEDLYAAGELDAAVALLRLAGLDENLDTGFDATGTCRDDNGNVNPAACPVMIDLRTDFNALISNARSRDLDLPDMPAHMLDRAELARMNALEVWQGLAALQRVTEQRIGNDRQLRETVPDHENLYLLAGSQNLGLYLDPQFRRQQQLLYQRLVGVPDIAEIFAQEAEEAWSRWQAMAPGFEDPERVRQQFLQVMSPRIIYETRLEALRQQAEQVGEIPWGMPSTMAGEYLGRRVRSYLEMESAEDIQRRQRAEQLERQVAAMGAFVNNAYVDRRGATPTEEYNLEGATNWYAQELREQREVLRRIAWEDPPPDMGLVDVFIAGEENIARLEEEYKLVMQGFSEMDAVVAPKISQLLLMNWIDAKDPYPNAAHAALNFLWQDAATQQRIRTKLESDIIAGRRLIPKYRSQVIAYGSILDAPLNDIYREFLQLQQDRIQQRMRESMRIAEARADARAEPEVFPGELELHVDPYFIQTPDGLEVVVDTRVDHEIYRAVEVEVATDVRIVPRDQIVASAGREAFDRALEITGLEEDDVLFAAIASAKVVKAVPPEGHENKAYPPSEWPVSENHLLLVPYEIEPPPVLADPLVHVCRIRDDAPEDFPHEDAVDFCDQELAPTEYDRVAIFFTPPRDFREPFEERDPFDWHILGPNGNLLVSGAFDPDQEGGPVFAKEGSPAPFVAVADLWRRSDSPDPAEARSGPGTYTLESRAGEYSGSGLFGQGERTISAAQVDVDENGETIYAEYEEFETFEIPMLRLHFQGFVMEQVKDVWWPDREDVWEGKLTIGDPQVSGTSVVVDAEAWWRPAIRNGYGRFPSEEELRANSRLTLEFPEQLNPGHEEMGEIGGKLEALERDDFFFTTAMHLLVPSTQKPPDRHLVNGGGPSPWSYGGAESPDICQGESFDNDWMRRFEIEYFGPLVGDDPAFDAGGSYWLWPRVPLAPTFCLTREPSVIDARTTLLSGRRENLAGDPERSLVANLVDPDTLWVIPVFLNLTDEARPNRQTLAMKTYGYAIYGAEEGTYDGPPPAGGPEAGDGPDDSSEDEDPDTDDPGTDPDDPGGDPDDPGGDPPGGPPGGDPPGGPPGGDPPGGDPPGGDPGEGDPGEGEGEGEGDDPGPLDPSNPDVAALIREWLSIAEPVENADGANFRYDEWGRLIGQSAPGMGETRPGLQPPPDGGGDPVGYTWNRRGVLDSIDHCMLEEYVTARLENASIAHCAGRYVRTVAVPRVVDLPVEDAVSEIRQQGLEIQPTLIGAAPSRELAHRVAEQRPSSTERLAPGGTVEIDIYGDYEEPMVVVPNLVGLSPADAQQELRDAGLELQPRLLGSAPTPDMSERVAGQDPEADELAPPGTQVEVSFYSAYEVPLVPVPDLIGLSPADAQRALSDAGFELRPRLLGAATTPEMSERVGEQTPAPGEQASPGSAVEVGIYSAYVAPGVIVPDVTGMTAAEAQAALSNAGLSIQPALLGSPSDAAQSERVNSQYPAPGTSVAPDETVRVEIWGRYVPPSTGILEGLPNVRCPAHPLGDRLIPGESGHTYQSDSYNVFDCKWKNPESAIDTFVNVSWSWRADWIDYYCNKEDSILDIRDSYYIYQPSGRFYSGSRAVKVEIRWHDDRERDWIFNLMRSYLETFEPYAIACGGGTEIREDPSVTVPSLMGLTAAEAQSRVSSLGLTLQPRLLGEAPSADLAGRVASQRPEAGSSVDAGSTVSVDIHGDYVPPVEEIPPAAAPFWVIAGIYMPGSVGAELPPGVTREQAVQQSLTDPNAWQRASPMILAFSDAGLSYYAANQFQVGARGAFYLSLNGRNAEGEPYSGNGALLFQVEGVYTDVRQAQSFLQQSGAGQQLDAMMEFNRGDGRFDMNVNNENGSWHMAGGPLEQGWSQQAMQTSVEFILSLMEFDCFLATAVYETGQGPQLTVLRRFRDEVLLQTEGGRALVDAYYWYGPKLAARLDGRPEIRIVLRPVMDMLAGVVDKATGNSTLLTVARLGLSAFGPGLEELAPDLTLSEYARIFLPWAPEFMAPRAMQER